MNLFTSCCDTTKRFVALVLGRTEGDRDIES